MRGNKQFQVGGAVWVYGGSSGGKRSNTLWRISGKCDGEQSPDTDGDQGFTSASLSQHVLYGDCNVSVEEIVPQAGQGEEQGPGDVMWHAAACIFDRFLIIDGGRRAPPRARGAAEKSDQRCPENRSATSHVHVFDTVTRRWVPFLVESDADSIAGTGPRFRHTLSPIGNATVSSEGSSAHFSQQVLLALGGLPSKPGRSDENCGTGEPYAIVCTWKCSPSGIDASGETEEPVGGRNENAEVGVLTLSWRKIRVNHRTNSWIGGSSNEGWIGHSCTEDSKGGLLIYGGTLCALTGLRSCGSSPAYSQAMLQLQLNQREADDLIVDVSELMPGHGDDVPGARFGHAACVVKSREGDVVFVTQGGCVEAKGCQGDTPHDLNESCKGSTEVERREGRHAGSGECGLVHLLDLRARQWRTLPLHVSRSEGAALQNRTLKSNGAARLAMVST